MAARRSAAEPARPSPRGLSARPALAALAARAGASKHLLPTVLFAVCFGAYVSNGDFLPGADQAGNMLFSMNLLKRHSLSLSPQDAPHAFVWTLEQPGVAPRPVAIHDWSAAADTAYRQGWLKDPVNAYYLAETTRTDVYVNTFGLGAMLAGLPVYALLDLFVDIDRDHFWWWHGAALTASLLVALAALFVFLAARELVRPAPALLVALAFGLGSCAWPVSSQALWQHPASTICLSLGALFLLRSARRTSAAAWCGAAFGMAALCRPTTAVVVVCAGAYLLWVDRRRCAAYVLGGLPFLVVLLVYNVHYFGSPFQFGQTIASKAISLRDTGTENLWQGSWAESLPGLLISPARGLAWFSPVLVLGLVSAVAVWKSPRFRSLIPLQAAVLLMVLVAGRWFDWWGGSTWGYRSIVDTTPFLALLMIPVIERVTAHNAGRVLFAALLAWSVGVQFVGAYSYSLLGWTDQWREHDNPDYASLWQWRRPQIGYHVANFSVERAHKKRLMAAYTGVRTPIIILRDRRHTDAADANRLAFRELMSDPAALHSKGAALSRQGRHQEAITYYRAVLEVDPEYALSHAGMGDALFRLQRYEEALESLARAVSLQPDLPVAGSVLRLMGRAAQELGRPEEAAEHYGRAMAMDTDDADTIELLALLRYGQQRYASALDLFRRRAELDPDSAQTYVNIGTTLYYLDRVEEAIRNFVHALSLDPDLETARNGLQQLRRISAQDER